METKLILPTEKSFKQTFSRKAIKDLVKWAIIYHNDNEDDDSKHIMPIEAVTRGVFERLDEKAIQNIANTQWRHLDRCRMDEESQSDSFHDMLDDVLFTIKPFIQKYINLK